MKSTQNRLLLIVIGLGLLSSLFAVNKKYQEGYELVSSTINTSARKVTFLCIEITSWYFSSLTLRVRTRR